MNTKDMNELEKVELIVSKTGCTYECAKKALESCGWEVLDALVLAEKEHAEKNRRPSEKIMKEAQQHGSEAASAAKGFLARAKEVFTKNYMVIAGKDGRQIANIPLWAAAILMLVCFWGMVAVILVAMLFGCRLHFEGRDLGRSSVNSALDTASQGLYEAGQNVKSEFVKDGQ